MTFRRLSYIIVLSTIGAGLAQAAAPESPATSPQTQPASASNVKFDGWRLYRESCRQILNGDFETAFATVQQAADTKAPLPNLAKVRAWTDSYEQLIDLRNHLHAREYGKYVAKAQSMAAKAQELALKDKEKGTASKEPSAAVKAAATPDSSVDPTDILEADKDAVIKPKAPGAKAKDKPLDTEGAWVKAMDNMTAAFWTADNEDQFRQEPWLKDFVAKAGDYADGLRRKGEWTDATRIYAELAVVLPDNKTYKDMRTRCAAHASLEATYASDSDWKDRIEGINPSMANDALWRIDKYYYATPDLKKMADSGLDRLIVLAETTSLAKTFDGLNDPDKRLQFVAGLRKKAHEIDKSESVSISDLVGVFGYSLEASRKYVHLPDEVVTAEFINGAFDSLDKFSSMIWPAELAEFKKHTSGEFSGVGIQINMDSDRIKVFSPLEDTPAYKAGIEPGDTIVGINGKPVKGITLEQAVRRITGEPGTSVTLTMERPSKDKPFDVTMKRAKIVVPTIKGWSRDGLEWNYFIDKDMKIAYVRVTQFAETTTESFHDTLQQLREQGMTGLIVDLRVNPGGLLKTAVEMVEMFLPPDRLIVRTQGRASEPWKIESRSSKGEFTDVPLIVLINDYSASASEIMAGALHAYGRALLVGERTYGKGSVQNPWPLGSGDAMLKLTTALYYLPGMDRSIHRDDDSKEWGVAPDVTVKLSPKEARRVSELRRQTEVLPGKSGVVPASATAPATQPDDEDEADNPSLTLQTDPQVETALLLMRVRLLSKEPWSIRMASAAAADSAKPAEKVSAGATAN